MGSEKMLQFIVRRSVLSAESNAPRPAEMWFDPSLRVVLYSALVAKSISATAMDSHQEKRVCWQLSGVIWI